MYINYESQHGMMIAQRRLRIIIKVRGKSADRGFKTLVGWIVDTLA
jgi:hypothetical protein